MECNCKYVQVILGLVVFVFAMWPETIGAVASKWVISIAAVLFIVHAMKCSGCEMPKSKKR